MNRRRFIGTLFGFALIPDIPKAIPPPPLDIIEFIHWLNKYYPSKYIPELKYYIKMYSSKGS